MATAVAKYAATKVLSKEMNKYKSKDVSSPYVRLPHLMSSLIELALTADPGPVL
jgi:hypothetical protein